MPPSPQRVKRSTKITAKTGKSIAQTAAGGGKIVYANRELSWLAFNRRVLEQAESETNPLLERTKFLAIVSSNLDEFFEIRIAGLLQQKDSATGDKTSSEDRSDSYDEATNDGEDSHCRRSKGE